MSAVPDENVFQFVPFSSFVQGSFWHKFTEIKLDVDRLSDARRPIFGFYSNMNAIQCLAEVDCTSFNNTTDDKDRSAFTAYGILHNKNTIEDFKAVDKVKLLNDEGLRCWEAIQSGKCLQDTSLLSQFIVLSFADLKKHNFYYWFAFPASVKTIATTTDSSGGTKVDQLLSAEELLTLNQTYFAIGDPKNRAFFVIERSGGKLVHKTLAEAISTTNIQSNFRDYSEDAIWFGFSDPSCFENAGWPARSFLGMLAVFCPNLRGRRIRLFSARCKNGISLGPSLVFTVRLTADAVDASWWSFIGWEKNEQQKMIPRVAKMAASMDPERLAKTSVDLNLKLMKWRLMPTLDLDAISGAKCLLMGAGTLGCAVARNLLAWGVKNITFVDNGKVSYSNPVRQSLYTFEDALNGGRLKATTAAKRLAEICPGLHTVGYNMHIPMPGHPIGADPGQNEKTLADIDSLKSLVNQHDAIFLLTDSRESRWLPTMLGAHYDKVVINVALGFDSYLVMRHGSRSDVEQVERAVVMPGLRSIEGGQLGCYFCNDITAPGNSLKDRTLDQQCTVTRPGVSNIASGLAVELLVSLFQHPKVHRAPAYILTRSGGKLDDEMRGHTTPAVPEGLLGIIPHSIRGQLSSFEHILPATEKFANCIACSKKVLGEFRGRGNAFLANVFDSAKYLEDLTGINESFHYRDDDALLELSDLDDSE